MMTHQLIDRPILRELDLLAEAYSALAAYVNSARAYYVTLAEHEDHGLDSFADDLNQMRQSATQVAEKARERFQGFE